MDPRKLLPVTAVARFTDGAVGCFVGFSTLSGGVALLEEQPMVAPAELGFNQGTGDPKKSMVTGWWFFATPLKKMFESVGMIRSPIYGKTKKWSKPPINTNQGNKLWFLGGIPSWWLLGRHLQLGFSGTEFAAINLSVWLLKIPSTTCKNAEDFGSKNW